MSRFRLKIQSAILASGLLIAAPVSAHVAVGPAETSVASDQAFSVSAPNEKDSDTVSVRLVFPEGLSDVSPNVQPGWKIDVKKSGTGDDIKVSEITWSGGQVPPGQQETFRFSATLPNKPTTLIWKAYQTYADGSMVSWDQKPGGKDGMDSTPYSETKVVNDITDSSSSVPDKTPLYLSLVAVIIASVAVLKRR